MKIYNSMTGKKEEFKPIKDGEVKMYACGITVYDLSHIGHARQAIVYSMITQYLRYRGYKVTYVRNYTDVDDKIIKRANEKNIDALEFSRQQIEENEKDMKNLHVADADVQTKASEYIGQIIEFVEGLIKKGYAYPTDKGDVYFAVKKFSEYGKLSHRKIDEMLNGVRIEIEEGKREPIDFALWKSAKPGEIYWESPWGKGRPGWHIECSAMALNTLGETIDIHGGGRDLLFPHHENEIAQSECLTGKPFAKYWTHCGLIKINGEKMSKSLGNSLTIRDALKMYNYEVIKYLMLSKHYGSDMDILDSDFQISESHMYYFYSTIKAMREFVEKYNEHDEANKVNELNEANKDDKINEANEINKLGEVNKLSEVDDEITNGIIPTFIEYMDDDFNTAAALSNLHSIFKHANNLMKTANKGNRKLVAEILDKMLQNINEVYSVLGLFEQQPDEFISLMKKKYLNKLNIDENYINEKIEKRMEAKKLKDFDTADSIRAELDSIGIILNDTVDGTVWDIKALY